MNADGWYWRGITSTQRVEGGRMERERIEKEKKNTKVGGKSTAKPNVSWVEREVSHDTIDYRLAINQPRKNVIIMISMIRLLNIFFLFL